MRSPYFPPTATTLGSSEVCCDLFSATELLAYTTAHAGTLALDSFKRRFGTDVISKAAASELNANLVSLFQVSLYYWLSLCCDGVELTQVSPLSRRLVHSSAQCCSTRSPNVSVANGQSSCAYSEPELHRWLCADPHRSNSSNVIFIASAIVQVFANGR